jgi:hypothetical protein
MEQYADISLIALMMEAAGTSETLVQLYQTTRCYNPEDSHLHTHRRENLKSYLICRYIGITTLNGERSDGVGQGRGEIQHATK